MQADTQTIDSSTSAIPVFNPHELLGRCLGNVSLAGRIIEKFCLQLSNEIPQLRKASERGDWEQVGALAHKLKGSAGAAAAPGLLNSFADLERMARSGEIHSLDNALARLTVHWKSFEEDLARCPVRERLA